MEEQALSQEMPLPDGRGLALTEEAHSHSWHGVGGGGAGGTWAESHNTAPGTTDILVFQSLDPCSLPSLGRCL